MARFFSEKEYKYIAKIFNLGRVGKINYFQQGYQTDRVLAETSRGKFIISKQKLSDKKDIVSKSKRSFQYEIDLLNTLKFPLTPRYIKSQKFGYMFGFKRYTVAVYKYLPGKSPRNINPRKDYQIGKFLGLFHKRGRKFKKIVKGRRKFYELPHTLMEIMNLRTQRYADFVPKAIVREVKLGVEKNKPPKNLPRGPIHVDIKPENELFAGNNLTGVVDFGNFYIGPFMVDVGKTIMWNCCKRNKIDKILFKKFMAGYQSQRRLSRIEHLYLKKSILFAIYSHIWVDLYQATIKYVPLKYALFLIKKFFPVARWLEKQPNI